MDQNWHGPHGPSELSPVCLMSHVRSAELEHKEPGKEPDRAVLFERARICSVDGKADGRGG